MNQNGNQGMLNHQQGGYGGSTNDDLTRGSQGQQFGSGQQNFGKGQPFGSGQQNFGTEQQQCGPGQQSRIGSQNQGDNTQRPQGNFTGQPVQSQGNLDTQGGQNIGQRGDGQIGAGQRNESVEQPSGGTSVNQR
jgi:hypothetical protein